MQAVEVVFSWRYVVLMSNCVIKAASAVLVVVVLVRMRKPKSMAEFVTHGIVPFIFSRHVEEAVIHPDDTIFDEIISEHDCT